MKPEVRLKNGTTRRDFVKTAVAAGIASASTGGVQGQSEPGSDKTADNKPSHSAGGPTSRQEEITFPRRHTGRSLARVSCPLGGIGTGGIELGGRGNLQDWQIFNRPDIGNALEYSLPCMYVKQDGISPYSVVLERRLLPPYYL